MRHGMVKTPHAVDFSFSIPFFSNALLDDGMAARSRSVVMLLTKCGLCMTRAAASSCLCLDKCCRSVLSSVHCAAVSPNLCTNVLCRITSAHTA